MFISDGRDDWSGLDFCLLLFSPCGRGSPWGVAFLMGGKLVYMYVKCLSHFANVSTTQSVRNYPVLREKGWERQFQLHNCPLCLVFYIMQSYLTSLLFCFAFLLVRKEVFFFFFFKYSFHP